MIDPIENRMWADNHNAFSAQIDAAFRAFWRNFKKAHAHIYRAPWQARRAAR